MTKLFLSTLLMLNVLLPGLKAQDCEITEVSAVALPCEGNYFNVSVNLSVTNPTSPGFTLAGNGVIYGTYLYSDLPVTVGPLLGDNESSYEFIAWDVENAACQQFVSIPAANCGPICSISNFVLTFLGCQGNQSALVTFDFDVQNPTGLTFDLYDWNGELIDTWLYQEEAITIPYLVVNGAAPMVLTVCDHVNDGCCETFVLDAIDCNPNNCEIFNVSAEPECTGNNFVVHLNFGYDNPPSDSFNVVGNNLTYGTFGYNELPITLGPLNGASNISWQFIVSDSESGSCADTTTLGIYNCPPPCNFNALNATATLCNGNDAYSLLLNADIEGAGDSGFAVFSESAYYGSYSYAELPLTILAFEGSGDFIDVVSVCDNENLGCCATVPFEALLCAGCLIYNLTATPLPCNAQDEIMVEINFNHQNVSTEGFEITGNGDNYGSFAYEDLPVQIGPFAGDGSQFFEFVVTDLVNQLCFEAVELGFINCGQICELSNLTVVPGDCTGNNTYTATIDFDNQGTTGVGFDLFINGELFDNYSYNDLPLTIAEFPSSGTGIDIVTVCENDNSACCATLAFAAPDCACHVFDASVTNLGCSSDTTFDISLEFFYENLPGNSVDVFLDGVFIGFYNIADIPLTITLPEGTGTAVLGVCANDLNNCCDEVIIELINCETPQCFIYDLISETGVCNSDSTFALDVVFNHDNLPSDSVNIWGNNVYIGKFLVQPTFIHIEHFPVLDSATTTLTVCAVGADDCCDTYTFETPDCSFFGQCHIWDLIAVPGDCNSDSTYSLNLEFNSQNLEVDSVIITGNGNYIGQYQVTPNNIVIAQFPDYGTDVTVLTVCAVGQPDCCDTYTFDTQDCSLFGQCNIWDLVSETGDCTSDSTYVLHINFNSQNLSVDSVVVTGNGNYIGQYPVTTENITIQHFPLYETDTTVITVCAVGENDCCDEFEYVTPNCDNGGPCHIYDLVATIGDCQTDSTYALFIQYVADNLPSDSVTINANEQLVGTFVNNQAGFWIDNFPVIDANHTVVWVCATGASDCCDFYEFETPNCEGGGTCQLFDLVADPGDCNGDSTYTLFINYATLNLQSDSIVVTTSEGYSAHFAHNADGFTIANFPAYNTSHTTITVCALGSEECCDSFTFETLDCGQEFICEIYGLFAETGQCTSDSTYVLDVVFDTYSSPSDSVLIYANDSLVGQYENNPDFIHIENFPHFPGEQTTVTVCAVGAPDCCASFTFETPFCTDQCVIYNIEVNTFECNSDTTFPAILHFDYQNIVAGGFDVYAGDTYLGFFTFEQVPIEIAHFPANETGQYIVTICESDNTECCTTQEFAGPACGTGGCEIANLTYTLTECDSSGNFLFILDFDFQNTGNEGFHVQGNGNNYGNFSYDNVPVQIGPFPSDDTEYEFVVIDNGHPDCSASIVPGNVNCTVATEPVDYDAYFQVFNNGSIPGIYAKKNIRLSLFNSNGKMVFNQISLSAEDRFELSKQAPGLYIGTISFGDYSWPVKLVKSGY